MKWTRFLGQTANSMSSIYKIVFTGLMLFEIVRYQLRRRRREENSTDRDHDRRG